MSKTRAIFAFVLGLSSFPVEAPADPRFEEAGALYEFVLSLGPVATTKLDK